MCPVILLWRFHGSAVLGFLSEQPNWIIQAKNDSFSYFSIAKRRRKKI